MKSTCLVDGLHGVYVPALFAYWAAKDQWLNVTEEQWAVLAAGPEHEDYWEAWDEVLDSARHVDGGWLEQDGDLFLMED